MTNRPDLGFWHNALIHLQETFTSTLEQFGDPNRFSGMALSVGVICAIATQLLLDGHPVILPSASRASWLLTRLSSAIRSGSWSRRRVSSWLSRGRTVRVAHVYSLYDLGQPNKYVPMISLLLFYLPGFCQEIEYIVYGSRGLGQPMEMNNLCA
jgi:hypothetical protein